MKRTASRAANKSVLISFRVSQETARQVEAMARIHDVSMGALARRALLEHVEGRLSFIEKKLDEIALRLDGSLARHSEPQKDDGVGEALQQLKAGIRHVHDDLATAAALVLARAGQLTEQEARQIVQKLLLD